MTVISPENKPENILQQENIQQNLTEKKLETPVQQKTEEKKDETPQEDPNWKAFREARKKDRAEKEAAEKRAIEKEAEVTALKAAMEAAFAKSIPNTQQHYSNQDQYLHEETEDERIEKKVQAAIAQREAQAEQARIQREQQEYPQRLTQTYPDFNHVISQENLDYLDYHYPEVSRPLQRLGDGFDKWSDIYKAVKKFVPNNTTVKKEATKIDANFNKPKSMSGPSIIQPGEVQSSARLTEERKAENWARMQKILKGVS